jgi:polysaccharide deacetylase 2 family uncharacterized protein YibQ
MQRLRAILQKYAHLLWWGSLSLLSVVAVTALVGFWVSSRNETDAAFDAGRRLVIAIDTGEVKGKRLSLDKPNSPAPAPAPTEPVPAPESAPTPPAETPAETPPAVAVPESAPPPAEAAPQTPPTETPPVEPEAKPEPQAARPASTTPVAAINPALSEETPDGRLPIIGRDGSKPWRYYAKPYERRRNQPMVAIIVSGLGTSKAVTQDALQLPENISLSFSPYTRDIATIAPAIRATGHELLIDLPLQPTNYPATDPGPNGLLLDKGSEEVTKHLNWAMTRFPAFIGFLTPQNESFTSNDDSMKSLLQSFANRGLMLVMGKEPPRKETRDIIDANTQAAALVADVLIDEDLAPVVIQQRLAQLEERAKKNGYAVGIAQAYPLTIEQLREWSAHLEENGVMLVPVSAIAKLRFS